MNADMADTFANNEDEINFVKGRFDHFSDIEKQSVIGDFVSNKGVLASLFDMMFQERISLHPIDY
jgi:hypothetical protein